MTFKKKKTNFLSDNVVEYILTRRTDDFEILSVNSIAKTFNMSRNKLWRSFKIEKGLSLEEYIFRVKMAWAVLLLEGSKDLSVKQIAEKIGYYCYDYFIRIFKRYFGTTPGKFRALRQRSKKP